MKRRALVAAGILLAWFAGLGMLVRREYFRSPVERLAEAALRVTPDAVFYAVLQGNLQVGFASSTVDTTTTAIVQRDYLIADVPIGDGGLRRTEYVTEVTLSRTLRLRSFELTADKGGLQSRIGGEITGDTLLRVARTTGAAADTQFVRIEGPVLLSELVPLAMALEQRPEVGEEYRFPVFDPAQGAPLQMHFGIRAESLFVVNDSSVLDSATGLWIGVLPDTIRAWQIVPDNPGAVRGWVDEQGRLVSTIRDGFHLQRRPYEVAFENWRKRGDAVSAAAPGNTVLATHPDVAGTLLDENLAPPSGTSVLRVLVRGPRAALSGLDLDGGRQTLRGDTVTVRRERRNALNAPYQPVSGAARARTPDLGPEPFLEVEHPEIVEQAERIVTFHRAPRTVAELIATWVADSVERVSAADIPSALHVLHTRRGDAAEHAQLFTALARAAGLPARVVSGVVHAGGKFRLHTWAEVLLHGWVAVDPTFGSFPADAAYLRLVTGTGRRNELAGLLDGLTLDVLSTP